MTPFASKLSDSQFHHSSGFQHETAALVWKRFADNFELLAHFYAPLNHSPSDSVPAVIFFPGGMWTVPDYAQAAAWATHLSNRGIACIVPEFRNRTFFEVTADDILHEGIEFWHWAHSFAPSLGIAPSRFTLAGMDVGALMALYASMQPPLQKRSWWQFWKKDILPLSPACVAIFRGIVDTEAQEARFLRIQEEVVNPDAVNPSLLLRKKLPPLFCAHGMLDPLMDYELREWFCDEWRRLGNRAEFLLCPKGDHSFIQFEVNPATFEQVLLSWEEFMVSLSLWPEDALEEPALI